MAPTDKLGMNRKKMGTWDEVVLCVCVYFLYRFFICMYVYTHRHTHSGPEDQLWISELYKIQAQFKTTEAHPLISSPLFPLFWQSLAPPPPIPLTLRPHPHHTHDPPCADMRSSSKDHREKPDERDREGEKDRDLKSSFPPKTRPNLEPSHQPQTPFFSPVVCRGGSEHSCRNISPGKFKWGRNGERESGGEREWGKERENTIVKKNRIKEWDGRALGRREEGGGRDGDVAEAAG